MNTQTSLIEKVKHLEESPLFQLSLGSKELFHSNFIAWLAGKYPKQVGQLFAHYLKDASGDLTITDGDREFKNIDIYLKFANEQELIIENKVKSIPYIEQLEQYTEGHTAKRNFLLLTLTKPKFAQVDKIPVLDTFWHTMSYSELANSLKTLLPEMKGQYDKLILEDYILFITSISQLFEKITVTKADYFTFYTSEIDKTLELLKEIRLDDLYLKLKYQQVGQLLKETLETTLPKQMIHVGPVPKERTPGTLYLNTGMTRAQGLTEIAHEIEPNLFASIQLQGNRYSLLIQGYPGYGKDTRPYAERLLAKKQWFNFSHISDTVVVYPKNEEKVFNQYGKTDFYKSVKLNDQYTVGQIIDIIIHDVRQMMLM